ncbi:malonyl-CoA decarboxylase N-terminal domain-containing protein [Gemmobacter sp. 24YEA27]|uniref:malonyl-CoA decarboxylase N-terminal domain-containing protein n=1 Tax=Gemmobacter sp. 24YEA27 TaxID=3040672 RepID=UPI0032C465A6
MSRTGSASSRPSLLGDLFESLSERGRRFMGWRAGVRRDRLPPPDLTELGARLLSRRGEASGVVIARALLAAFEDAGPEGRLAFLRALADDFGPDPKAVQAALAALQQAPDAAGPMEALHSASEPRRQELLRRLNLAPGGTAALVRMREELIGHLRDQPELRRVDQDFAHLFGSWFNRASLACAVSTGTPRPVFLKRSSATRPCMRSATGTICATACSPATGAAMGFFTRS